jgi:DMSO/TMAO reductase YedYZ molybdopterin-dependent catalytic subunit
MQHKPELLSKLPVHPTDREAARLHVLRIDGLVGRELVLTPDDLDALPKSNFADKFSCLEGWTVTEVGWRGIALEDALAMSAPRPEAQWVQASAGEFSVPIKLQQARRAILATHIGESPLPREHGGPVRLVVPGGDCFTSIKWLDHLELRAEPGRNTGESVALGRLVASRTPKQ